MRLKAKYRINTRNSYTHRYTHTLTRLVGTWEEKRTRFDYEKIWWWRWRAQHNVIMKTRASRSSGSPSMRQCVLYTVRNITYFYKSIRKPNKRIELQQVCGMSETERERESKRALRMKKIQIHVHVVDKIFSFSIRFESQFHIPQMLSGVNVVVCVPSAHISIAQCSSNSSSKEKNKQRYEKENIEQQQQQRRQAVSRCCVSLCCC